jgi:hypothetical protein
VTNKVQEIQGAIAALADAYGTVRPFLGVILAGVLIEDALNQPRSLNLSVVYFSCESVIGAFKVCGIDPSFEQNTPDAEFHKKVATYAA